MIGAYSSYAEAQRNKGFEEIDVRFKEHQDGAGPQNTPEPGESAN